MWNGTLYGITTWSVVFAVDARTGRQLWTWDPQVNRPAVQPKVCCGIVNRGVAIYEGKIIAPIIDGRLVALDAITGKARLGIARRVSAGAVHAHHGAADREGQGDHRRERIRVSGARIRRRLRRATTGQRAWRFYTVPGDPSKGFENDAMRKAAETWSGEWWKMGGGGTVWDSLAYDPRPISSTSGPATADRGPSRCAARKGKDNLYVCSIIALRPDTGEMRWYYQVVPGDSWDYDSTQQLILADVTINRQPRRVIMQANKNGFYYVLDRITGAFISAQPFAHGQLGDRHRRRRPAGRSSVREAYYGTTQPVTIMPGADRRAQLVADVVQSENGPRLHPVVARHVDHLHLQPGFRVPGRREEYRHRPRRRRRAPTRSAAIRSHRRRPGSRQSFRRRSVRSATASAAAFCIAWDPIAQKERWRKSGGGSIGSGTVTTAGNLVFQTITDGRLLAYAADTGEQLLEIQTGQRSGMGPPMTCSVGRPPVRDADGRSRRGPLHASRRRRQAAASRRAVRRQGGGRGNPLQPGPGVPPRMLTFVLDGKAPLPSQP